MGPAGPSFGRPAGSRDPDATKTGYDPARQKSGMGSRRLRIAIAVGTILFVLIAIASLVSGTLPAALEVLGAIPPAVIVGVLTYVLLPVFGSRR